MGSAGGASPASFRFLTGMLPNINETITTGQPKNKYPNITKSGSAIRVIAKTAQESKKKTIDENDKADEII